MTTNTDRLRAALAAWNAGDLESYLALYDPAIRLHGYSPAPMDKTAVAAFYRDVCTSMSAPGAKSPPLKVIEMAEGEGWVSCAFEMTGAQVGPFMGVPATGRPFRVAGVTMLRFNADGRVVERYSSVDFLGLMVQIGAVAMPG